MFEWTKHLDAISEDAQRLQGLLKKAIEREGDPGLREHLQQLDELMSHSMAKIKETLPAAEAHLNKEIGDIQQAMPVMEKNIAAAEQGMQAAMQAAAAAAAVPAVVPFDPRLGLQLRDELLKRFSPARPEQTTAGEVAAMTSAEFDSGEPAPPPPPPPKSKTEPPRRKPKDAKSSDENWSFDG